jgi:hypothetical protein
MKKYFKEDSLSHLVLNFLEKGHNRAEIEHNLVADGYDAISVRRLVFELTQFQADKRRIQAVSLIISGGLLCFLCLMLAIMTANNTHNQYYMAIYGFSSLGALLALAGDVLMVI